TLQGLTEAQEHPHWLWQGCLVALEIWDDALASSLSAASVEIARDTGMLTDLGLALSARTAVLVFNGDLGGASTLVSETIAVAHAAGVQAASYGEVMLSAWQGRSHHTAELIEMTEREAGARGEGIGLAVCAYARAVLSNGKAQYEDAFDAAASACEHQ